MRETTALLADMPSSCAKGQFSLYLISAKPMNVNVNTMGLCYYSRLITVNVAHTPANVLFINFGKSFKFTLKYTIISILHVSVFNDHHQGDLSVPN